MQNEPGYEYDTALLRREQAWDEFLQAQPNSGFMQSSWWADFLVTRGWGHCGVVVSDGDTVVGGARVMTYAFAPGKCFYYIPEGPVLPQDEADGIQVWQQVLEYIEKQRTSDARVVSHLRLEPRWEQLPAFISGFQEGRGRLEPRDTRYIPLTLSENALLAQMQPKGRYNIKVAQRHAVTVVEDTSPQGLEDFLYIYQETVTRHDLRGKSQQYFHTLLPKLAALQCGTLFFAEYQGKRIAAVLVIYFGCRATYFYGGSLATHRHVMAPYLLHFEIMRHAKARGCQWYDLYGIAPLSEPQHAWANISVFKRKLGGQDLHFVPALDYIYNPSAYEDYQAGRRHKKRQAL